MRLFQRTVDPREALYAEAQALVDDGLDPSFVLGLYPGEADWLAPLLHTATELGESYAAGQPSFYFEGSLKARFLAAARERFEVQPVSTGARLRTAFAAGSVMLASGAVAVLTLAFVTANSAVPGDWNYSFKLAHERMQYALSRGDGRVDVQIGQAEERVKELQQRSSHGDVSSSDLEKVQREVLDLAATLQSVPGLDADKKERVKNVVQTGSAIVETVSGKPGLETAAASTKKALEDTATAAGVGTVTAVTPTTTTEPTATVGPAASATASVSPAGTPSVPASVTPPGTATPPPTATATPVPSPSPGPGSSPSPTATTAPISEASPPAPSATPSPAPEASSTPSPSGTPEPTAAPRP